MRLQSSSANQTAAANDDYVDRVLAAASVVLLISGLGLFWIFGFGDRSSSDAAVTLLLAQHILETGVLLPPDWYYGNGDIWIIGPQMIALPFVAVLGITPIALAFTNALGLTIIFLAALTLGRVICGRWAPAVLTASICIALYSHFQREFVIIQLSYGWMSAKLFLLMSSIIVWLRLSEQSPAPRKAYVVLTVYLLLLCAWTVENPVRPVLYLAIPLVVVLALRSSRIRRPTISIVAATFVGLGTGIVVRQWLLTKISMAPGLESFHLASPSAWIQNALLVVEGSRHLYGGEALGDPSLPTAERALALLRLCMVPAAIVLLARPGDDSVRARQWRWLAFQVAVVDIALIVVVLIIGSTLADPIGDRYLIPAWHLCLVGLVAGATHTVQRWQSVALLLVLAFLIGGFANAVGIMRAHSSVDVAQLPHPPPVDRLIELLQRTGIRRGFATHRYANVVTVRSRGEIEICDVLLKPELAAARWVNTKSCSDPNVYAGGFFIVLAPGESTPELAKRIVTTVGEPVSTLAVDGYEAWLFPNGSGNRSWLDR